MCSLLSNTPPVPMHAALETHSSAQSQTLIHPCIHPLTLTLSALNAEKRAYLRRCLCLDPGPLDQVLLQRGKWQIFPVSGRLVSLTVSLSLSPSLSRSISLSSFPLLPCSERSGAGRGLGVDRTGLGVLFGGEETSVKERKGAQGDKKAIRGQSSLTSRRNV